MKPRKRPISLETDVYRKLWELEHKAYLRAHAWKITIVPKHSTDAYYRQQYHQLKIQLP